MCLTNCCNLEIGSGLLQNLGKWIFKKQNDLSDSGSKGWNHCFPWETSKLENNILSF